MPDDPRVRQLLEEALDSSRTPEEVCREYPELLLAVREQLKRLYGVEAQLDALFGSPSSTPYIRPTTPACPDAPLPPIPGYEMETLIGHGGMGVVYKARHLKLKRSIAIKMMLSGVYAGAGERERFMREAESMASLRHPHIVQIHDVGEFEGLPYFTMEFVEGGNLAQKLAGMPQPANQAATLVATLAEAVQVAHDSGTIHRDLKPANILLTDDGTPKITDFGLARRVEEGPHLTLSGARIGTPSYMAPEQAIGKAGAIGPAVDVYALGAILYETLTGRPPFRAETAAETERQVIAEEPAPPSRLNAKVPRDLETICLKCLHKAPARRYVSASALAADLHRFLRLEPIEALPQGPVERSAKWVRRHPALATAIAGTALLVMATIGGGVWLALQQEHRRRAVEADLTEVAGLQERARWAEARAALARAETRLGTGWPDNFPRRLEQARIDLDLVVALDEIRLNRATRGALLLYKTQAAQKYEDAFRQAGLGTVHDPPRDVATKVNASAVRWALVAALDDWAICSTDKEPRRWILEVARSADFDPEGWLARVLDPAGSEDPRALAALTETIPIDRLPISLLMALGERLSSAGGDAVPFLKRVQRRYPADFWTNLILGNALLQRTNPEATGYYRAALASRPTAAVGYCAVGDALRQQNELPDAIDYYQKALQLEPTYARAHSNLGHVLLAQGRVDEAIVADLKALELDPDYAWAHNNFGNALRAKGRLVEAFEQYRDTLRLDPKNGLALVNLRPLGIRIRRAEEVRVAWKSALDANPPEYDAWDGYAELSLFLGLEGEYRRARRALIDRFGSNGDPLLAERTGRAYMLLPASEDELGKAVALIDLALAADRSRFGWARPYFLFAKGLAEYRQGRLNQSVAIMEGEAASVLGPAPRIVAAMASHRLGHKEAALQTLAAAVLTFDWRPERAEIRDFWICHTLRREAEVMILPYLPSFLQGDYEPGSTFERLAMLGVCQSQRRFCTAARLYADALTTDPRLAEKLNPAIRYTAACYAALAGIAPGEDEPNCDESERARWRQHARDWLRTDLAALAKQSVSKDPDAPRDGAALARELARRTGPDRAA